MASDLSDFIVVFAALGAIGVYVGASWLVAKSARGVNAALARSDRVLTWPVSVAVLAVPAIFFAVQIVNFFQALRQIP